MKKLFFSDFNDKDVLREALGFSNNGCVLALGFFDGVHIAHRELISRAYAESLRLGIPLAIFTFSGSSQGFKSNSPRLYSDEERFALFEECNVDFTLVADFEDFSQMQGDTFIEDIVINLFNTRVAVCGYNFRFGKGASTGAEALFSYMKNASRDCIITEEYKKDGISVSTTYIKELISNTRLDEAGELLGVPYFISGTVEHGKGLGKELGIPTVNTNMDISRFLPPKGVYASFVFIEGKRYAALTNIGECPTFGKRGIHAETYILNFSGDLYGSSLRIYLTHFLRKEKFFPSSAELIEQIENDTKRALALVLEE